MDFERPECGLPCSSSVQAFANNPAPIRKRRFSSAKIQPVSIICYYYMNRKNCFNFR